MSIQRRLALRLMDHAVSVMPTARKDWTEAMRAEFSAMPTDREALAWASGCVWASYVERTQPMDVFMKSLVRAFAVWLVPFVFVCGLSIIAPIPGLHSQLWKLVRLLSEFYGGMFATLWICEILLARYWTAPKKVFQKMLVRTLALWLWPVGLSVAMVVRFMNSPHGTSLSGPLFSQWLQHWLVNWLKLYPVLFVAMFVPLYVSELLIARYWRSRLERAA